MPDRTRLPHPPNADGPIDVETPHRDAAGTPWIETREGGLFFVNALLATPAAVVLLPLLLGLVLRAVGLLEAPSRLLDTIPRLADHFLPWVGWLAAPAAWMAWKSLRETERRGARVALAAFLAVHAATLFLTVWRWTGA